MRSCCGDLRQKVIHISAPQLNDLERHSIEHILGVSILLRAQTAKNEKVDSLHIPAMKFIA